MNIEINENMPELNLGAAKNTKIKKKRKLNKPKKEVVYTDDELSLVMEKINYHENKVCDAVIKLVQEDGIVVEVEQQGAKIDAFIPKQELAKDEEFKEKDLIRVLLEESIKLSTEPLDMPKASHVKALDLDLLEKAKNCHKNKEIISAYVIAEIKGGYSLAIFVNDHEEAEKGYGLRAFLPRRNTCLNPNDVNTSLENTLLQVTISNINLEEGNIVVSMRELLASERQKAADEFFASHNIGDEVLGKVSSIMPYGAFIDLGLMHGFVHISDISWDKKPRIHALLAEGDEVKAKIIELDTENKKVKLSIKDLIIDPWLNIEKYFELGSEVKGKIVGFADFGAFVKLEPSQVEGLIHIGEITWQRIRKPSDFFKIGDNVKAAVLRIDKETKRLSLSSKALELSPVDRLSSQFPVGAVIKTKITSIHDFGVFITLDEKNNALVPRSEISWSRTDDDLNKNFQVGQEVEVAILRYDVEKQRATCSMKQLMADPWQKYKLEYKKGSLHKTKIVSVTKAGVLCELKDGLFGFCPKNQLSSYSPESNRMTAKVGDEIEVVVTMCDHQTQKISLSQRMAIESETKKAYSNYLSQQNQSGKEKTTLADAFRKNK